MNYTDIYKNDTTNGPGIRVVLWVSGCDHHCHNCHNPQTWDSNNGSELTLDVINKDILIPLGNKYINGITLSGGDPLYKHNLEDINNLIKIIKSNYPDKTIWLYSGYTYEEIINDNSIDGLLRQKIISEVNVFVDGLFVEAEKDITLLFRGSRNQRLIDIPKTMDAGNIILWDK